MATTIEYRLRIGNAALTGASLTNFRAPGTASGTALTITSTPAGTNPYLASIPTGDASKLDVLTGRVTVGAYRVAIADAITSGTDRVVTAALFDASNRPQLIARPANLEWRRNTGGGFGAWAILCAGYVSQLRLESAAAWEVTITDQSLAARQALAFRPNQAEQTLANESNAARTAKLQTWYTRWPIRGCLLGGVMAGGVSGLGWLGVPDYGGWQVYSSVASSGETQLVCQAPYGSRGQAADGNFSATAYAQPYYRKGPVPGSIATGWFDPVGDFEGLVVTVGGNHYAACRGDALEGLGYGAIVWGETNLPKLVKGAGTNSLSPGWIHVKGTITAGATVYRMRIWTVAPSVASPLYVDDHPVNVIKSLFEERGEVVNAASVTTAINAMGSDLRVAFRVTESPKFADFLDTQLYTPFGLAVRRNASGEIEPVFVRTLQVAAPSVTFTGADVAGAVKEAFSISESDVLTQLTYEGQEYTVATADTDANGNALAADRVVARTRRIERTFADAPVVGGQTVDLKSAGHVHMANTIEAITAEYATGIAQVLAARMALGAAAVEATLIRTANVDALVLGDVVSLAFPQSPNAGKRYGEVPAVGGRANQVVQITEGAASRTVAFQDVGSIVAFSGTAPTISIAASSYDARRIAEATITNAATLNGASPPIGVRIVMASTTGAAPASTVYVEVVAFPPGSVPTGAIALPPVTAGRTVYVKVRGERVGYLPGSYSAASSVGLTALTAPTATGTTSVENKSFKVTWTPSAAALEADVYLYQGAADPGTWGPEHRIALLAKGSSQQLVTGLTASTQYRVAVRERYADGTTSIVSAGVTTAAAASASWATAPTLTLQTGAAPGNPAGYLVNVAYGHADAQLELQMDTVNTFVTAQTLGPYEAGTILVRIETAADGTTRYFRARHVSDTKDPSAYSATVSAAPIAIGDAI